MVVHFKIIMSNKDTIIKVQNQIQKTADDIKKQSRGAVTMEHKFVEPNIFLVDYDYPLENELFTGHLRKSIEGSLKKEDRGVKVQQLK